MALITTPKDQRSVLEQQTARQLQEALGRTPSQTEIYQKAYNSAYPVFADEYGTPDLKKKVDEYTQAVYTAPGQIRKDVLDPTTDKRYRGQLESVFKEGEYDPLTRRRIIQGIMKQRETARNNQFNQRYNQYQTERAQSLFDYRTAMAQQSAAEQAAAKAEQDAIDYQQQLALKNATRSNRSTKQGNDPNEAIAYANLISQGAITYSQVPSNYKGDVAELMNQYGITPPQELSGTPSFEDYLAAQETMKAINIEDPNMLNALRVDYNQYLVDNGFQRDVTQNSTNDLISAIEGWGND